MPVAISVSDYAMRCAKVYRDARRRVDLAAVRLPVVERDRYARTYVTRKRQCHGGFDATRKKNYVVHVASVESNL
jgi:hypothetical protein